MIRLRRITAFWNFIVLVVQVNGQVCDYLEMPAGTNKSETERLALTAPKVQTFLEGKQIRKVIVVPERLENIVYSWSSKSLITFATARTSSSLS